MRKILLHTIAFEPARWSLARVSQDLEILLPALARLDAPELEIYEPHLARHPDESSLPALFCQHGLRPVILSSYLNVHPDCTPEEEFMNGTEALVERVRRFDFSGVRLFPGSGVNPSNLSMRSRVAARIRRLCQQAPEIQFLLETHDGSIADDPQAVVELLDQIECRNVALLFQPTEFSAEFALAQIEVQAPHVRYVHLQNRKIDKSFERLEAGVIPWGEIMKRLPEVPASLEFIPSAICPVEQFDLELSIAEAEREIGYARSL